MGNKHVAICNRFVINVLFTIALFGCSNNNNKTEKYQKNRDSSIINVKNRIIGLPDILPVRFCTNIKIINDVLIIMDSKADRKGVFVYDKKTFKHITTTGFLGNGPGEIVRYGNIVPIEHENAFYLPDFGKCVITKFCIDSILTNALYKPEQVQKFGRHNFATNLEMLDDSIFLGIAVAIAENHTFRKYLVNYNIKNNEMKKFGYHHPQSDSNDRKKTYFRFKIIPRNNTYVKCYSKLDLMTICDLNGNLKYNIYGPGWNKNKDNKKSYFTHKVDIYNEYIITTYLGKSDIVFDKYKRPHGVSPTKFIVFNLDGDYLKTIETNHNITNWCVDENNKRIIAYFDDSDIEFGYFNIDFLDKL